TSPCPPSHKCPSLTSLPHPRAASDIHRNCNSRSSASCYKDSSHHHRSPAKSHSLAASSSHPLSHPTCCCRPRYLGSEPHLRSYILQSPDPDTHSSLHRLGHRHWPDPHG